MNGEGAARGGPRGDDPKGTSRPNQRQFSAADLLGADAAARDSLRSKLIADLARRFEERHLDPDASDMPAFL